MKLFKLYGEEPSIGLVKRKFEDVGIYSADLILSDNIKLNPGLVDLSYELITNLNGEIVKINTEGLNINEPEMSVLFTKAKKYNLWAVHEIDINLLSPNMIQFYKDIGNISLLGKFSDNGEINKKTSFGNVGIDSAIETICRNGFHKTTHEYTNIALNIDVNPDNKSFIQKFAFCIENKIAPYLNVNDLSDKEKDFIRMGIESVFDFYKMKTEDVESRVALKMAKPLYHLNIKFEENDCVTLMSDLPNSPIIKVAYDEKLDGTKHLKNFLAIHKIKDEYNLKKDTDLYNIFDHNHNKLAKKRWDKTIPEIKSAFFENYQNERLELLEQTIQEIGKNKPIIKYLF
jgi:hypothetical protein